METLPIEEFKKLHDAMPKCKISAPYGYISYILDSNDDKIGEINWLEISIMLYKSYEHCDEVLKSLGEYVEVKRYWE